MITAKEIGYVLIHRLMPNTRHFLAGTLGMLIILSAGRPAQALTRIRDIARPAGERTNMLTGLGLVVGLDGNGDGGDLLITARPLMSLLIKMGNPPTSLEELKKANNVALVAVTAELGRNGVRNGDKIDVQVSSIGSAKSLAGGNLLMTPLRSTRIEDDRIYAWAQGSMSIPDPQHKVNGVVKNGADIEIDFIHDYHDYDNNGQAYFDLVLDEDQDSWQAARILAMTINEMTVAPGAGLGGNFGDEDVIAQRCAVVLDPRNIRITIPVRQADDPASFITRVMNLVVDLPEPEATIYINEKTGTIAFTGNVEIAPVVVHVNGLSVRSIEPPPQPQPGQPLVNESQWSKFDTATEAAGKINDLISVLDQLNVPIQEKINAIYALRDAGALRARIKTN